MGMRATASRMRILCPPVVSRGPDTARGARRGRRARCGRGYVACRVREGELCVTTVGSRPESARRQAQLQGRGCRVSPCVSCIS